MYGYNRGKWKDIGCEGEGMNLFFFKVIEEINFVYILIWYF